MLGLTLISCIILTDGLLRIKSVVKKVIGIQISTKTLAIHLSAYYLYLFSFSLFYAQILLKLNSTIFDVLTEIQVISSVLSQACLLIVLVNVYRVARKKLSPESSETSRVSTVSRNTAVQQNISSEELTASASSINDLPSEGILVEQDEPA